MKESSLPPYIIFSPYGQNETREAEIVETRQRDLRRLMGEGGSDCEGVVKATDFIWPWRLSEAV